MTRVVGDGRAPGLDERLQRRVGVDRQHHRQFDVLVAGRLDSGRRHATAIRAWARQIAASIPLATGVAVAGELIAEAAGIAAGAGVDEAVVQAGMAAPAAALPSSLPAAAVVSDDLPSGLGIPLPAVDFKEDKKKTSKCGQLEKTSGDEMSIAHGAGLIDKLGLKRRKVKFELFDVSVDHPFVAKNRPSPSVSY